MHTKFFLISVLLTFYILPLPLLIRCPPSLFLIPPPPFFNFLRAKGSHPLHVRNEKGERQPACHTEGFYVWFRCYVPWPVCVPIRSLHPPEWAQWLMCLFVSSKQPARRVGVTSPGVGDINFYHVHLFYS